MGQRKVPPRAYCDICEEFDLHETENCPQQESGDVAVPSTKEKGQKPPPRPYCEFCEGIINCSIAKMSDNKFFFVVAEFGHDTEDCQNDQTF